jgi:hypothetical protein
VSKLIAFFLVLLPLTNLAQYNLLFQQTDTIKITHRSGGIAIDSLDNYYTGDISLTPGGAWNNPFGKYGADYLSIFNHLQKPLHLPKKLKSHFTALPHLGFIYSFGSKGLQYVHADYQQSFRNNTNLNIHFDKNAYGNIKGMMRNTGFDNQSFQVLLDHRSKYYEGLLYMHYIKSRRQLSGGIISDTLIDTFGLEFVPVRKDFANSEQKSFDFGTQHAINFNKDTLFRHGLVYKNRLSIENREFFEEGFLTGIYQNINLDSNSTRDQYQLAKINNAAGYFLKTNFLQAEALMQHSYWDYQNLARHRDTSEIEFQGNIGFRFSNFSLQNEITLNLVGAQGEWSETLKVQFKQPNWNHSLQFETNSKLPTVFQRSYFSNNQSWNLSNLKTMQQTGLKYDVANLSKWKLSSQIAWKNMKNTYFFMNDTWRNDTLTSINLFTVSIGADLKWRSFHLQPRLQYSMTPESFDFIPQYDLRAKLFFNKKLFKAKRLDFIIGVDVRYQAGYRLLAYQSNLDLFIIPTQRQEHKPVVELSFFTGFKIDVFRFYFKFENIDYFWNSKTNHQQAGFPINPSVIRLGLTWDFFN